jgi:hypothetical protein
MNSSLSHSTHIIHTPSPPSPKTPFSTPLDCESYHRNAIEASWRLSCASRAPCARSFRRRPPPHSARCPPPRRPVTRSRRVPAACPTSRSSPSAAPSWARPSLSRVLVPEALHSPAHLAVSGLTTPASTEPSCTLPRPKRLRLLRSRSCEASKVQFPHAGALRHCATPTRLTAHEKEMLTWP